MKALYRSICDRWEVLIESISYAPVTSDYYNLCFQHNIRGYVLDLLALLYVQHPCAKAENHIEPVCIAEKWRYFSSAMSAVSVELLPSVSSCFCIW